VSDRLTVMYVLAITALLILAVADVTFVLRHRKP
jgi:hypothetical protein